MMRVTPTRTTTPKVASPIVSDSVGLWRHSERKQYRYLNKSKGIIDISKLKYSCFR